MELNVRNTVEISSPLVEPITTERAKKWLSVGSGFNTSLDENDIDELILSARQAVESEIEKPIIIREFQTTYDRLDNSKLRYLCGDFFMELPKNPIASIVSVKYFDEDNVLQTIASDKYYFDNKKIVFKALEITSMRAFKSFVVNYTAGFSSTQAGVNDDIKTALKFFLSDFWKVHLDYLGHAKDAVEIIKTESPLRKRARDILRPYISSSFFDDGGAYGF